jgi:hypothetical protein
MGLTFRAHRTGPTMVHLLIGDLYYIMIIAVVRQDLSLLPVGKLGHVQERLSCHSISDHIICSGPSPPPARERGVQTVCSVQVEFQ